MLESSTSRVATDSKSNVVDGHFCKVTFSNFLTFKCNIENTNDKLEKQKKCTQQRF